MQVVNTTRQVVHTVITTTAERSITSDVTEIRHQFVLISLQSAALKTVLQYVYMAI